MQLTHNLRIVTIKQAVVPDGAAACVYIGHRYLTGKRITLLLL